MGKPLPAENPPRIECTARGQWRRWLHDHHATSKGVWLVTFKKSCGTKHIPYAETVEEALCFGWVDSRPGKVDDERSMLYFSPRKPKSGWAKPNKIRVRKLLAQGLMQPAGLAAIKTAKANGSWTLLDEIEEYVAPAELQIAFDADPKAKTNFDAFPPSTRRGIYQWIIMAKRPETRAKRVRETVDLAAKNVRANQYVRADAPTKKPGG